MKKFVNFRTFFANVIMIAGSIGSTITQAPRAALGFIVLGILFDYSELVKKKELTKKDLIWLLLGIIITAISGVIAGLMTHDFKSLVFIIFASILAVCITYFNYGREVTSKH